MSMQGIAGVPRVPGGMATRGNLVERIGRVPLTVIRAPGGRGKTVLMAQWAATQQGRGAWTTVEPDIGSRLAFWTTAMEGLALKPPTEMHAHHESFRGALLRAFRAVDEPIVLVIDDAHELQDPLVLEDVLAVLRACRNISAVVGTRASSELEAPREALTLDIVVIGPEEMTLTAADVESIVGAAGSRFGSTAELLEASGGSPLLLRAILAGSTSGIAGTGSARSVVVDHLRGLFENHAELEAFASATSIPDEVDIESAGHLSGLPADQVTSLLASLESDGLVMRRDASSVARYRYHPLVREALRDELRRRHPEQFRHASLLASTEAEARRQFIPALRHAVEAGDYTRASDICLHGGFDLLRAQGAAAILQQVPLRFVARLPFLAIVLGLAANARGERFRALELLTLALGASRAWRKSQRVAERAGLALIEAVVLRITGRASDSAGAARRMLAILEEAAPVDLEEIADQLGSYRHQGALSLFRAGLISEARAAAERVGISAQALAVGRAESLGAASLIAAVDAARGDCLIAASILARIEEGGHPPELLDGYVGALAHLARGILALEEGDADAAQRHVDVFAGRPNLEFGMMFTAARAMIALWRGTPELGLRALDQREENDQPRARVSAEDRRIVAAMRVLLHAALGHFGPAHAAHRILDRADPMASILQATLLILEQRPASALEVLNRQREWGGPRLQAAAELLTAAASLERGDEVLAGAALRRFVATSTVHGTIGAVLLVPADHRARLWEFAARVGVDAAALARFAAVPAPFHVGTARVLLTPRESDVLEQLRDTASFSEIASTLSVSANTVKTQVRTLYRKLEVTNRDDALRAAYLQGLLGD